MVLDERDMLPDPIEQFGSWFAGARSAAQPEPEAMALATATVTGVPSVRFVLLRGFDARGFVFYSNDDSRKGRELSSNPVAALVFRWWTVARQVRVSGAVSRVDAAESDSYWATRERGSQLGAWASPQSAPLPGRSELERRLAKVTARFEGTPVPRPEWWGGYRVTPSEIEFWQQGADRLHDRILYTRSDQGPWTMGRLGP